MLSTARGVTAPANQGSPANEGSANTVISVMRAEFVLVEYFDTEGRRQQDILLKAGDEYYTPANNSSVAWAGSLKSVRPWLKEGTNRKLPVDKALGVTDSVDILAPPPG
jgi:hypothetical protein